MRAELIFASCASISTFLGSSFFPAFPSGTSVFS